MKKLILLVAAALICCSNLSAQTFDDVISRYDSSGVVLHIDSSGAQYVNLSVYKPAITKSYYKLYYLSYLDTSNVGKALFLLSGYAHYNSGVTERISMTDAVYFSDVNSNAYDAVPFFHSKKFFAWYIADQYGLTLAP